MADDDFEVVGEFQMEVDEAGKLDTSALNMSKHVKFIKENLIGKPMGFGKEILVRTGAIITEGNQKGMGRDELREFRLFKAAANSLGVSIRINHRHRTDGYTSAQLFLVEKRVFSDETVANRTKGLTTRLVELGKAKVARLEAAAKQNPSDEKVKEELTIAKSKLAANEKKLADFDKPQGGTAKK